MEKEASYGAGLGSSSWQSEVQAAVSEPKKEKLLERVHAAEVAIFHRLQDLGKDANAASSRQSEREALAAALETLRLLKRDRLGFPDWTKNS
jgi:hypothetical protein